MGFYMNNSYNSYSSFRQEDGKVIGRIRTGLKSATPSVGGQDYRFFVEPLSPLPRGYDDARRMGFTGFMSRIGYDCASFPSEKEAWQALEAEWSGSLVLFTPALRNNKYFVLDDVQKEAEPLSMEGDAFFTPIPVFAVDEDPAWGGDINKFCAQLSEGKPLPGLSRRFWDRNQLPPFILASFRQLENGRKKMYALFAPREEDTFGRVVISEGGAYFGTEDRRDLGCALADLSAPEIRSRIVLCRTAPLCFMPAALVPDLKAGLQPIPAGGDLLASFAKTARAARPAEKSRPVILPGEKIRSHEEAVRPAEMRSSAEKQRQEEAPKAAAGTAPAPEPAPAEGAEEKKMGEKEFLARLVRAAETRGLLYDKKDLINFHVSLKVSRLVILAGMSGTGKSGLVRLYADAMGLPAAQSVMIPVRPSWMDDSDLLGYLDMKNMIYRPADTGLAELLIEAEKHPEKMYIVCFDEMNLARAEHYFAQFLSALEKEDDPVIRLYNPALAPRIYNSASYPAEIRVGRNILFTGTVNVDESTYHFSDKILDRANVIALHQGKFRDLMRLAKTEPETFPEISAAEYDSYRKTSDTVALTEDELDFLDALNDALRESGLQSGIGYRVARQMGRYLLNIPEGAGFTREDGIDCQTVQRILTKLRGSGEQLRSLLSADEKGLEGEAAAVLSRWSRLSPFTESRKVLLRKARELKLYDYTI